MLTQAKQREAQVDAALEQRRLEGLQREAERAAQLREAETAAKQRLVEQLKEKVSSQIAAASTG